MMSNQGEIFFQSKPRILHLYILFILFIIIPVFLKSLHSFRYFGSAITLVGALSVTTLKSFVFTGESVTRKYIIPAKIGLMTTEWDYEEFEKAVIIYKTTKKGVVAKVVLLFKLGDYELENKLPPEFTIRDESFFSAFEEFLKSKNIIVEIKRK